MSMFDVSRVSVEVGESEISFETGKLARQADGAVVVRYGGSMVLCTTVAAKSAKDAKKDKANSFFFLPWRSWRSWRPERDASGAA